MLTSIRRLATSQTRQLSRLSQRRTAATATATAQKSEGTIADAFASLSGQQFAPLAPRFADIKRDLIRGKEEAVAASWNRLLNQLKEETQIIAQVGSSVVPEIDYRDIENAPETFNREYRKRGVAVIRNVIPEDQVLAWKEDLKRYIRDNPHTKAFPADSPQVYELYWSQTQFNARANKDLLKAQKFLLSYWHSKDPNARVATEPVIYCDRLRMRQPGDSQFALGPHIDGGGVERWEPNGYGLGKVYDSIFAGEWEAYDPWEASSRLPVESDLYKGNGTCSAFRMSQGWLGMSHTGPYEGTLLVNPLLQLATAYLMLRPFFTPTTNITDPQRLLDPSAWALEDTTSSWLQGATPGRGQELTPLLHPHLRLDETMVHIPRVAPGDYVAWHCDSIHAVDKIHAGASDSSVLYIPACPLTDRNASYMKQQRDNFLIGIPPPDFPGGEGESRHIGRPQVNDLAAINGKEGLRAFGLEAWEADKQGLSPGERAIMKSANEVLGF